MSSLGKYLLHCAIMRIFVQNYKKNGYLRLHSRIRCHAGYCGIRVQRKEKQKRNPKNSAAPSCPCECFRTPAAHCRHASQAQAADAQTGTSQTTGAQAFTHRQRRSPGHPFRKTVAEARSETDCKKRETGPASSYQRQAARRGNMERDTSAKILNNKPIQYKNG